MRFESQTLLQKCLSIPWTTCTQPGRCLSPCFEVLHAGGGRVEGSSSGSRAPVFCIPVFTTPVLSSPAPCPVTGPLETPGWLHPLPHLSPVAIPGSWQAAPTPRWLSAEQPRFQKSPIPHPNGQPQLPMASLLTLVTPVTPAGTNYPPPELVFLLFPKPGMGLQELLEGA